MIQYIILCGAAPEGFQQKKLVEKYYSFSKENDAGFSPAHIVMFPNCVSELLLEGVLNNVLDAAAEEDETCELVLYFCARMETDLCAELSDSCIEGIEVVRLGKEEIRKDVIEYYARLAEKMDLILKVECEVDSMYVNEEELGYERV